MTILVIEDDRGLSSLIQGVVEDCGYECTCVYDGSSAIEFLTSHQPFFMILDYSLTDMTALEIVEQLRASKTRIPPFMVSTGQGDERTAVAMMKLGALDYIVKDATFLDLLQIAIKRIAREVESENSRKRAEEALLKSEEKYRVLVENLNEVIFLLDENGVIDYVSPAVEKMSGYSPDELVGRPYFDFSHPDDMEERHRNFSILLEEGKIQPLEYRLVRKDGGVVWVRSNTIVNTENGRFKTISGTLTDITERKRAEEALQNMQRLKSLGTLAGGIAHDFNNLLSGIFGFIELAARTYDQELKNEYLERALGSIERARALTSQLLTFAKGGAPVKARSSLCPFIADTVKFALSGANVFCRFNIDEKLWVCEYDRNQIGQVLDNLVINAVQAMPDGGKLEVSARNMTFEKSHASLPNGNYVKISVIDNGVGIEAEALPHILDPFFTTREMGHGLGLATCYSIVSRHNGLIEVESEPGQGSTFSVYLPAVPGARVEESSQSSQLKHGSGLILIMDDEKSLRDMLAAMVKIMGFDAVCAKDGSEAIKVFADDRRGDRRIFAVICDLTVPGGLGGREVIKELREIDDKVPVFVASGYGNDPVMAEPQKYGFMGSIGKPFGMKTLSTLFEKHLVKQKS